MTLASTPVITAMRVIPVAGRDGMLLNLSGAHAPFFTRNLLVLTDSLGHTGVGEVPGGEKIAVAHSLGCINWLVGARSNRLGERFDRVVFVAPPDPDLLNEIEGAKLDLTDPEWRAAILRTTERFSIVSSENDRWIPRGIDETYTQTLGFTPVIVPGCLHFSIDDGWGKWQGMFEWLAGNGADDSLFAKR